MRSNSGVQSNDFGWHRNWSPLIAREVFVWSLYIINLSSTPHPVTVTTSFFCREPSPVAVWIHIPKGKDLEWSCHLQCHGPIQCRQCEFSYFSLKFTQLHLCCDIYEPLRVSLQTSGRPQLHVWDSRQGERNLSSRYEQEVQVRAFPKTPILGGWWRG